MPAFGKDIRSLVFDLDGTLYSCKDLGAQIENAAVCLVAESRGLTMDQGRRVLQDARSLLAETPGEWPPLSKTCQELGLDLRDFIRALEEKVHPERFLQRDPNLIALLRFLRERYDLYLYTNNGFFLRDGFLPCWVWTIVFAIYTHLNSPGALNPIPRFYSCCWPI